MSKLLDNIREQEQLLQAGIQDKLEKGSMLTDEEVQNYKITDKDAEMMEVFKNITDGGPRSSFSLKDFLSTPQAKVLIPRIIIGQMKKAAEPVYLASNFFKKIRLKSGSAIMFPQIGVMKAGDVAEGQEYPQMSLDWQTHKGSLLNVGKSGLRVQFTDELISDCEFDIVAMMLSEAGRALARHKEQKAFVEFLMHGWKVFDNSLRSSNPDAGTTGVDFSNNLNNTMSVDDLLDLIIAVYNNEYTPTDLIMHPLAWTTFAKNGLTGGLSAPMDGMAKKEGANGSFKLGPDSIQGRLPFAFDVNISPFAPLDKRGKTFDMFCIDKNNVGVEIVRDDLKTEEFRDPARDIKNVKIGEKYGFGTYNEGRAIAVAKGISMAKSYPVPERVIQIN